MHGSRREDECQQSGEPALLRQPQPGGEGPEIVTVCAPLIEVEGRIFKDLARTGELLPYEDWRLDASTRAADLAGRLSVEQIAGLMLYSPHQTVPALPDGPFPGTYGGKDYDASGARPWDLTDQQRRMLADGVRHVLVMNLQDAATAARWNNAMQAFCEALPLGIPVNASSDPRNGAAEASAEFKGGAGGVSRWPEGLGMAALFDPERMRECASIISREYRALGIVTALGPKSTWEPNRAGCAWRTPGVRIPGSSPTMRPPTAMACRRAKSRVANASARPELFRAPTLAGVGIR